MSSYNAMTISIEIHNLIVSQHNKGKSAKEISDNLEVELRTVNNILRQYRET